MLLDGLRSSEVLGLQLQDLRLADEHLHVLGEGNKERTLPLQAETFQVLQSYLRWERPLTNSSCLFVSLKGGQRGHPMTTAGLRSLFRHHRRGSQVPQANPHRFPMRNSRHTFATVMLRLRVSLPALMQLLGHRDIRMTRCYVEVTQQDLQCEVHRARLNIAQPHLIPMLPLPPTAAPLRNLPAICDAIAATRRLLEMFRRQWKTIRTAAKSDDLISASSTSNTNSITSPIRKNEPPINFGSCDAAPHSSSIIKNRSGRIGW